MKKIVTILTAVVLGTLMFNASAVRAGDKEMSGKYDSKSYKHDEHRKDFWKDFCYDYCYGYPCDYYWYCYDYCNYDRCGYDYCGYDHCDHDGCSHDGCTTNGLPRIGNNPPGVPPHEGPPAPKPNPNRHPKYPSAPKPVSLPILEKDGANLTTVFGQQGKKGSGTSSTGGRPAPKK
jgi:hypothetical protein